MDIGSDFNAACFMDKEGNVLGRYPTIYNSRKGFEYFQAMVMKVMRKHKFTDVLIGMEPTGHYWRKIAFFAKEKGYEVRFVRTTAVKHQRELDESSSAKSAIKDAYISSAKENISIPLSRKVYFASCARSLMHGSGSCVTLSVRPMDCRRS